MAILMLGESLGSEAASVRRPMAGGCGSKYLFLLFKKKKEKWTPPKIMRGPVVKEKSVCFLDPFERGEGAPFKSSCALCLEQPFEKRASFLLALGVRRSRTKGIRHLNHPYTDRTCSIQELFYTCLLHPHPILRVM